MNSYLTEQDIAAIVDAQTLNMLLGGSRDTGRTPPKEGDTKIVASVIPAVIETVKGFTRHWYDMEVEMRPIYTYDARVAYKEGSRVMGAGNCLYIALQDTSTDADLSRSDLFKVHDDRNPKLVEICATLVVHALFRRVNPRQIPEQRQYDQEDAMKVLRDIQRGRVQLDIVQRKEVASSDAGQSICWGRMNGLKNEAY
ncbi:MAG: phage protein Gp36 family protein [Rikenellaceae bacterium]